jgi:hypothetical protein
MKRRYKLKITDYRLIHISKWKLEGFDHYGFLEDKRLFNYNTNRFSKKVVHNYSVGFNLDGKFYTLEKMKNITSLVGTSSKNYLNSNKSIISLYDFLLKSA